MMKGAETVTQTSSKMQEKGPNEQFTVIWAWAFEVCFFLFNSLFICFTNDYLHLCMSTTTSVFPFFNLTKFIYGLYYYNNSELIDYLLFS